ncbi:MAG TPA: hypothetical protein VL134_05025, partial [Leptolyngbya sp.]|nr:hypothetical protein [Leptolyngbya sp.]
MRRRSSIIVLLLSLAVFAGQDMARSSPAQLYQQGIEQYQSNHLAAALKFWQQALQQFQQLGDRQGEGATLVALSAGYLAVGDNHQAIRSAQQLLQVANRLNNQ